jgi:hypothetical protein
MHALLCASVGASLVAPGVALAASAPSASTGRATAVTATSATLTGTVNPQGQATTYHFEYGASSTSGPLYVSQTAPASAASGTANVSVSAAIGSLTPNTTYHYRLVATNASGPTFGADRTFTTVKARAPAATTGAAKPVAATSATLTGTVNPEGQTTTYQFQYGSTTAYGNQTASSSAGGGTANTRVSAAIGSLIPNTTYHYRLVATNASGPTFGADKTLTTSAAVPGAPVVATGGAKSVTATSARVTGTVNPKGIAAQYYVQYGHTTVYGFKTAQASAGAGTRNVSVSAEIGSLAPDTTYHYRLVATNASGTTFGADRHFTTSKASTITLAASPGAIVFGQATTLSGRVLPPGPVRTTITLQRAISPGGPFVTVGTTTSTAMGNYSFGPVALSSNNYFRAVANGTRSAPVRVLVRFRISLLASATHPRRGDLVRFHGTAAPRHNRLRVLLQRLGSDHSWHTVARPRLHRASGNRSAYSVRIAVRRSGLYRAVVGPDARHAKGFSRVLRIRVR